MNVNETAEQLRNTGQSVMDTAQEWTEKAKGTVRDAGAAADLYVHEYAWTTTVLVAVVAGCLGYLIGSHRH